jgi:uncharacterized protein (TIGR02466 family)
MMSTIAAKTTLSVYWRAPEPGRRLPSGKLLPLLRAAVAAAPDRADFKLQLAKALFHSDRMAEIVDWLSPNFGHDDAHPELLYYLGRSALAISSTQLAFDALRSAAMRGFVPAFGFLADALVCLGRPDEALEAGFEGLERSPADFKAFVTVARALLGRRQAQTLWELCACLRARNGWGAYMPSAMVFAAATCEHERECMALIDPPAWFSATRFAVRDDYNQGLAEELLSHKSLSPILSPSNNATTGTGRRINHLEFCAGPLTQDLLSKVRDAVDAYVASRQASPDHPMIAHRPESVALNSWALTLHQDGHETWHVHPHGWISGVYYVKVPRVAPSPGRHPGAIEFGPYPLGRERDNLPWPRWHVMPQAGLLLLFPSYYAHRTWPTSVDDTRICVAFDVVSSGVAPDAS